jgi:hypothetical protein
MIRTASGQLIASNFSIVVYMQIAGHQMLVRFLYLASCPQLMILGMNFMNDHGAVLRVKEQTVTFEHWNSGVQRIPYTPTMPVTNDVMHQVQVSTVSRVDEHDEEDLDNSEWQVPGTIPLNLRLVGSEPLVLEYKAKSLVRVQVGDGVISAADLVGVSVLTSTRGRAFAREDGVKHLHCAGCLETVEPNGTFLVEVMNLDPNREALVVQPGDIVGDGQVMTMEDAANYEVRKFKLNLAEDPTSMVAGAVSEYRLANQNRIRMAARIIEQRRSQADWGKEGADWNPESSHLASGCNPDNSGLDPNQWRKLVSVVEKHAALLRKNKWAWSTSLHRINEYMEKNKDKVGELLMKRAPKDPSAYLETGKVTEGRDGRIPAHILDQLATTGT